jgi:hypothetical protein
VEAVAVLVGEEILPEARGAPRLLHLGDLPIDFALLPGILAVERSALAREPGQRFVALVVVDERRAAPDAEER